MLDGGWLNMALILRVGLLAVLALGAVACGFTPDSGPPTYNRGIGGQSGA